MAYRSRTYIAGDWTGDKDLIDKLYEWNNSKHWSLHFIDAHELTQARDSSLYCNVKKSLAERLNVSKIFVLIVGEQTTSLTKGSCQYCKGYNSWTKGCAGGHPIDYKSYIEYECEKADRDGLRIVVIYNCEIVQRSKCPRSLRYKGAHIYGYYKGDDGEYYWNYEEIKKAIMEA